MITFANLFMITAGNLFLITVGNLSMINDYYSCKSIPWPFSEV